MANEPPPTFDVLTLANFEVDPDPIGLGTFGSVHFALTATGKTVAVKAISKKRTKELAEAAGQVATVDTEVSLLREVGTKKHRNILKFHGAWEDERYVYVAQGLCAGGELADWLMSPDVAAEGYTEATAARVTYDVLQALHFIHELHVIHRDIKPQNLMFTEPKTGGLLKLIDFGLATRWVRDEDKPLEETCGTIDYMAPETIDGAYGDKVDVWAVGVMLHILLSGKHPLRGPSRAATEARCARTASAGPALRPAPAERRLARVRAVPPRHALPRPPSQGPAAHDAARPPRRRFASPLPPRSSQDPLGQDEADRADVARRLACRV